MGKGELAHKIVLIFEGIRKQGLLVGRKKQLHKNSILEYSGHIIKNRMIRVPFFPKDPSIDTHLLQ